MSASPNLLLGEVIYIAVKPIFKIYLIIGVGYYLARKNILSVDTSRNISAIAIQVLIPCLAFQKIVSNISNSDIHQISTIVIISFFIMGSCSVLTFIIGASLGCPKNWYGGLICCGLLPNISDLPIAYLQTMETSTVFDDIDKGVSYVMIYFTLQMLVQFNFGAFKLIEMDFKNELKGIEIANNKKKSDGDDLENQNNSTPMQGSSSSNSTDNTKENAIELQSVQHNPALIVSNNDPTDDLHSIDSEAVPTDHDNSTINDYDSNHLQLEPISHRLTNTSRLSQLLPLSKTISVPHNLFDNDRFEDAPETMQDIIRVYSRFDTLKNKNPIENYEAKTESLIHRIHNLPEFFKKQDYKQLGKDILDIWIASTLKIVSITLILSIVICMIPWVQALFVVTPQAHIHPAPDGDPPLSFIMDFAGYIGAAEVPFGLLLLGGTIGRLQITKLPKNVWKVPMAVTFFRLFIFPIIGCALNSKIHKDGLFYGEDILYFISNINFCLPPATSLIYITAFYTPVDDKPHIQMDSLALIYIFHYIFLVFCLPFVTTYTMKVALHY